MIEIKINKLSGELFRMVNTDLYDLDYDNVELENILTIH
jgi:hypothetical protein